MGTTPIQPTIDTKMLKAIVFNRGPRSLFCLQNILGADLPEVYLSENKQDSAEGESDLLIGNNGFIRLIYVVFRDGGKKNL